MICPFMEQADPRCAAYLSLTRLADAFTYCVGRHQSCPVYQHLSRNRAAAAITGDLATVPAVQGRLAG